MEQELEKPGSTLKALRISERALSHDSDEKDFRSKLSSSEAVQLAQDLLLELPAEETRRWFIWPRFEGWESTWGKKRWSVFELCVYILIKTYGLVMNLLYGWWRAVGWSRTMSCSLSTSRCPLGGRHFFLKELYIPKELYILEETYTMVVLIRFFGFKGWSKGVVSTSWRRPTWLWVLFGVGRRWTIDGVRLYVLEEVYVMVVCLGADMGRLYLLKELYFLKEFYYMSQLVVILTNLEVVWVVSGSLEGPGTLEEENGRQGAQSSTSSSSSLGLHPGEDIYMGDSRLAFPLKRPAGWARSCALMHSAWLTWSIQVWIQMKLWTNGRKNGTTPRVIHSPERVIEFSERVRSSSIPTEVRGSYGVSIDGGREKVNSPRVSQKMLKAAPSSLSLFNGST